MSRLRTLGLDEEAGEHVDGEHRTTVEVALRLRFGIPDVFWVL